MDFSVISNPMEKTEANFPFFFSWDGIGRDGIL